LDTATAYYDAVMRLVEVSRAKLPLRLRVMKYEDVVGTFETTIRGVLAFLELGWDEGVRRLRETGKEAPDRHAQRRAGGAPSLPQRTREVATLHKVSRTLFPDAGAVGEDLWVRGLVPVRHGDGLTPHTRLPAVTRFVTFSRLTASPGMAARMAVLAKY
jgi:hypothetical protein